MRNVRRSMMGRGLLAAALLVIPLRNGPALTPGPGGSAVPDAARASLLRATTAWLGPSTLTSRSAAAPVPLGLRN